MASMELQETNNHGGFWTNEKHANFIYSMEASFVRSMLESDSCSMLTCASSRRPRLNRYLPDSSDSTLDLKNQKNPRNIITTQLYFQDVQNQNTANSVRTDEKTKRQSSQPHDASQDQVVPQVGNSTGDENESSERKVMAHSPLPQSHSS